MKSFQMKALSLAVLALAGFGMAGSAFAACPTIPATSNTPGGGGAWTSQSVTSATFGQSATGGLNGTSCALQISINAGAASNAKGNVTDASPNNETRYRARFYVNTANMTNMTVANRQFRIFNGLATTGPGSANTTTEMIKINVVGGATLDFRFQIGNQDLPGYTIKDALVPNNGGNYRVEFDLQQGASAGANCNSVTPTGGCFRYWVSDAATATTDAAPTGTAAVTNTGWSGMKQINLGVFGTSALFRTNVAGQHVIVDEFDSRRQTFIGL